MAALNSITVIAFNNCSQYANPVTCPKDISIENITQNEPNPMPVIKILEFVAPGIFGRANLTEPHLFCHIYQAKYIANTTPAINKSTEHYEEV